MMPKYNLIGHINPMERGDAAEAKEGLLENDRASAFIQRPYEVWKWTIALVAMLLYTGLAVVITTAVIRQDPNFGQSSSCGPFLCGDVVEAPFLTTNNVFIAWLPDNDHILYAPKLFSKDPRAEKVRYFDTSPSEEIDGNWHELFKHQNIRIPRDMMRDLGRLDEGVELPGGDYMASPMVFHSLHCLKSIYRSLHPDYYTELKNLTGRRRLLQDFHIEHCLHLLKQSIQCSGDMTLLTMRWEEQSPLPLGNFSSPHQCVRWSSLMEWVMPRSFDAFADGVLVHPQLGPAFIDRRPTFEDIGAH